MLIVGLKGYRPYSYGRGDRTDATRPAMTILDYKSND